MEQTGTKINDNFVPEFMAWNKTVI